MREFSPRNSRIIVVVAVVLSMITQFVPLEASAAGFQRALVRLDRMKINTATGGTVCAQPATVATEASVQVGFPSDYTVNTTAANWTVTTTNLPLGATAWPGIATASSASNTPDSNGYKVVTFASNDLTVGTLYCFNFAAASTLTTATVVANSQQGMVRSRTSAPAEIDFTQIALANITDDQILVTAVVPPTFIFTLSGNADPFQTNLTPTAGAGGIVSTTGVVVEVTTNAKGGWVAWAKDQYQGLNSAAANYTIPSPVSATPTTINGGTEGYVMDVDETLDATGGCDLAIDAAYNGTTTAQGGTLRNTFQPIAACTAPPSPATANGDQITLIERATISGATPAGSDYSDIITVVGAGSF